MFIFFFKQKTAYELRISDWSSDVCSSDLALTGINFSVSAAVGLIVLAGVSVLNGLVVMTAVRERQEHGLPLVEAIREGMSEKMRAVIMTGFVPAVGFIPMAIATGTGAEVQKPLAVTVIGGLIAEIGRAHV